MYTDIVCLAVVLIFALWGIVSGGMRWILRAIAIGAGFVVAQQFSPMLATELSPLAGGWFTLLVKPVAFIGVLIVSGFVIMVLGGLIISLLRSSESISSADRTTGFFVGTLIGLSLVVGYLIMAQQFTSVMPEKMREDMKGSQLIWVIDYTSLDRYLLPGDFRNYLAMPNLFVETKRAGQVDYRFDDELWDQLEKDTDIQRFMNLEKIQEIAADQEKLIQLQTAMQMGGLAAVINHPITKDILSDPAVAKEFNALDLSREIQFANQARAAAEQIEDEEDAGDPVEEPVEEQAFPEDQEGEVAEG